MASFLSRMGDGTLAVSPFRIDRSDPGVRLFDDNAGLIDNDPILFTSSDGGRTWSDPQVQELPGGMNLTAAQGLVELDDGRWLATFDQWPAFGGSGAYEPRMWSCTSADRGRTWSGMTVMADGAGEGKGYWHGRALRLSDGRIFSLLWAADMTRPQKGPVNLKNHFTVSDPAASAWEKPAETNLPGQTSCTAQLAPTAASPRSTPAARPAVPVSSWPCQKISAPPGTSGARCRCGTPAAGRPSVTTAPRSTRTATTPSPMELLL